MASQSIVGAAAPAPKLVIEARERFGEYMREAERLVKERCDAEFHISRMLLQLQDRANREHDGIQAAISVLPGDTDADEARAVLELLRENAFQLSNDATTVAGLALLVLAEAGAAKERAHG